MNGIMRSENWCLGKLGCEFAESNFEILFYSGATELLQIIETRPGNMPAPILKQSCETVALGAPPVQGSGTLPRPPPPPKTPRPPSAPPESQPLLPHTATLGNTSDSR